MYTLDVQASKREAGCVCVGIDSLHFLKGHITFSTFFDQRVVITWSLLSVRNVVRISKFITDTHWIKESDGLICTSTDQQLGFLKVTNVYDRGIVSIESLEDWNIPWWP